MSHWKNAKQPAIRPISARGIFGFESPSAIDTEKASIARPTPSSTLFTKNEIPIFILIHSCIAFFPAQVKRFLRIALY